MKHLLLPCRGQARGLIGGGLQAVGGGSTGRQPGPSAALMLPLPPCRYASLYFCCAIEGQDNELITLELIHRYVELLDKYFGSVSNGLAAAGPGTSLPEAGQGPHGQGLQGHPHKQQEQLPCPT